MYPYRFFTVDGGFMSYGVRPLDLYKGAASYVDRILRGEKVADLPIQLPTKYRPGVQRWHRTDFTSRCAAC